MSMSKVTRCDVTVCAFNQESACHAPAINVGDELRPLCDTFVESAEKAGEPDAAGQVGACKVKACQFNKKLECSAPRIAVGLMSDDPTCTTYESKLVKAR